MHDDFQHITVEQLCEVIDLLHPCMDDYLYVYDFLNDFYYISPQAVERFRLPGNTFRDVVNNHGIFTHPEDLPELQEDLRALLAGEKNFHNMEYRWLDLEGQPIWINCRGYVVKKNGHSLYMIGCINEIGARQKADNVSGLLGESSLAIYLNAMLPFAPSGFLLRLGLDDFKEINEKLGVEYGDMVLKRTAECISSCLMSDQKLYRIVADEFLVVDFCGRSKEDAHNLYRQIRLAIDRFVEELHYEAVFTISGGIFECRNLTGCSYSDLMKLSEFALNEAKRNGKNRCYLFRQESYDKFLKKMKLMQLLKQSVNNNYEGFEAYFQPVFHSENNTLYSAEALMRFKTEEFGMVPPIEFIPLLEETGLIIPAGRWMLHQALSACSKIQEYVPDFRININISYIQVMKSDIIREITKIAREYHVDLSHVVVELTESGLLESNAHFTKLWAKMKRNGIYLALDDFGTGYSNFHYLYDLQPDIIKIDRNFTCKALNNEYEYNLLSLMSDMVHNLNLKICVEGIETEEERIKILKLAPDYTQGFYYGKPCPFDEFFEKFVH